MKNVIFDLGGVILKGKASSILDKFEIEEATRKMLIEFFINCNDLDYGNATIEDIFNSMDYSIDIQNKYKDILVNYYKYRDINMELINYIKTLKPQYKLFILSDNNKEAIEYYKNQKIFEIFDGWVGSCDYHTIKKEGILFDRLLEKYNLNPEECFFVDDNPINIKVAEEHGIKGFIFNDNVNELENSLLDAK